MSCSRIAIFKVADPTPEKRRDFFREVLVELERLPETYREEMQRKKVANKLKRQRMAEVRRSMKILEDFRT